MIRLMEPSDLEQVAELEKCCFSEPWSYAVLEAGLHSPYDVYYVWEQEQKVLGYCNLRFLAGEGEIQRIAVLPAHRRLGLARKMMEEMVHYATVRHAAVISLEVRESNAPARRLYESYGFQAEAVRKGYYRNPSEDAVIMWKRDMKG